MKPLIAGLLSKISFTSALTTGKIYAIIIYAVIIERTMLNIEVTQTSVVANLSPSFIKQKLLFKSIAIFIKLILH